VKIRPTEVTLGATVYDIDLRRLDDRIATEIVDAWHEYAVLVFPKQHLDDKAQIAFSRLFGNLERLLTASIEAENPEVFRVANVRPDGTIDKPGESYELFHRGNQYWHTDSSYKLIPSKASVLRAHTVPPSGGETQFADMRAAYDALDHDRKARLKNKIVVHDYIYSQGLIGGLELMTEKETAALPPVEHPLIQTHPDTGRTCLFAGRHASHIVGEDLAKSRTELAALTEAACQPPRVYTHKWHDGDIAVWDNRCVLHRGQPWPQDQPRIMFRTTVAGQAEHNEWMIAGDGAGSS